MPLSDLAVRTLKPRERAYKVYDRDGLFYSSIPRLRIVALALSEAAQIGHACRHEFGIFPKFDELVLNTTHFGCGEHSLPIDDSLAQCDLAEAGFG